MERGKTVVRNHNDVAVGFAFTVCADFINNTLNSIDSLVSRFHVGLVALNLFLVLTPTNCIRIAEISSLTWVGEENW